MGNSRQTHNKPKEFLLKMQQQAGAPPLLSWFIPFLNTNEVYTPI